MSKYRIAVVVGSLRRDSINRSLARALYALAPADFEFHEVEIGDLPLYNQDDDAAPPAAAQRLKAEIAAAQGVLFVTPEYNRSIPGVLKNAIDHASRPYGQSAWAGKPAGVIGASMGTIGTALAQQHLRSILSLQDMPIMGQPEAYVTVGDGYFADDGSIADPTARAFLQKWIDRYIAWVTAHTA